MVIFIFISNAQNQLVKGRTHSSALLLTLLLDFDFDWEGHGFSRAESNAKGFRLYRVLKNSYAIHRVME